MPSGRNLQQPGGSVPGTCPAGVDRGPRMISGAHGVGMTTGVHRGIPAARAGFPRASSPGMLNMVSTGNMPLKSVQGVPNAVNVHPGAMSAPGNSILIPRDPMQMIHVSCPFSCIVLKHLNLNCITFMHKKMPKAHVLLSIFNAYS
jgi:hypothetical protein